MKIIKITKKKNLYNILLSDKTSLSFYEDTIIKYNLLKPQEISKKELEEIIKYNNEVTAYNIALKYITSKLRTRKEIRKKLKDYDNNVIENVIKRLEKNGLINDTLYIKSYINDQVNLTNNGPKKITRALENLGFKKEMILLELENIEEYLWNDKINKIISKKLNSNHNLSKAMFERKIQVYLINLGYEKQQFDKILKDVNIIVNDDILKREYNKIKNRLSRKYEGNVLTIKIKNNLYQKGFDINKINEIVSDSLD